MQQVALQQIQQSLPQVNILQAAVSSAGLSAVMMQPAVSSGIPALTTVNTSQLAQPQLLPTVTFTNGAIQVQAAPIQVSIPVQAVHIDICVLVQAAPVQVGVSVQAVPIQVSVPTRLHPFRLVCLCKLHPFGFVRLCKLHPFRFVCLSRLYSFRLGLLAMHTNHSFLLFNPSKVQNIWHCYYILF